LLSKDGWVIGKQVTHGLSMKKDIGNKTLVTIIPTSNASLPRGTLGAILGDKQTKLGKDGLLDLLNRYGL
jgi:predicted RNA binding protein YcfA (HicA-like mRNA interferase family)